MIKKIIVISSTLIFITLYGSADGADTESSLSLGYKAYQDGNYDEAIKHLQSLGKKDKILSDYALYYLGEAYLSQNKFNDAFVAFEGVTTRFTTSPMAPFAVEKIGDAYAAEGDAISSIHAYSDFLSQYPNHAQTASVLFKLTSTFLALDRKEDAAPFIKRLLMEFPQTDYRASPYADILDNEIQKLTAEEFYRRERLLYKAGQYKQAIVEIEKYLFEDAPCDPCRDMSGFQDKLRLLLGQSHYQTRAFQKARESFKGVVFNAQNSEIREEAILWIARSYIKSKNFAQAKEVLKTFTDIYPESKLKDEVTYRLAMIAQEEGEVEAFSSFLRQIPEVNPASVYMQDALWQISWLKYKEGNYEESLTTLKLLEGTSLRMRSLYWQGKIYLLLGKSDESVQLFTSVAKSFPLTYYSLMSQKALEAIGNESRPTPVSFNKKGKNEKPKRDKSLPFQRTRRLLEIGLTNLALRELASIEGQHNPLEMSLLYKEAGDHYHAYVVARTRLYDPSNPLTVELSFPQGYKEYVVEATDKHPVDPLLVYSVMMQESEFDQKVISTAGAIGLMQIMPGTGEMIAKRLSHKSFKKDDLLKPSVNIPFGTWYLKSLMERFKGNLILALAGYNAGPNAVDEWLKRWGNLDMDEFVENIPYPETRRYVEKIFGYYGTYKAIYLPQKQNGLDNETAQNYD